MKSIIELRKHPRHASDSAQPATVRPSLMPAQVPPSILKLLGLKPA